MIFSCLKLFSAPLLPPKWILNVLAWLMRLAMFKSLLPTASFLVLSHFSHSGKKQYGRSKPSSLTSESICFSPESWAPPHQICQLLITHTRGYKGQDSHSTRQAEVRCWDRRGNASWVKWYVRTWNMTRTLSGRWRGKHSRRRKLYRQR